jgi:hypothetical protein
MRRSLYCRKLFALLRWLGVLQQTIAQHLGVSEPSVPLWATGTRPLLRRRREAFLALTRCLIAQAYAPLKPILAGTACRQLAAIALPDPEYLLDYNKATYLYLWFPRRRPQRAETQLRRNTTTRYNRSSICRSSKEAA